MVDPEDRKQRVAEGLRRRRAKVRQYIEGLKSKPCADCGGSYHPFVMDFDHRPGETKSFNIASALPLGFSEPIIAVEAAKCDVVCSNCHRMRTLTRKLATAKPLAACAVPYGERTHCPQGHPYDAINTKVRNRLGLKTRECVTCIRDRDKRRRPGKRLSQNSTTG